MAATPAAPQFQTYAAKVTLAPGQTLHFATGKGYYAGPSPKAAPPAPATGTGPNGPAGFGARGTAGGPTYKPSVPTPPMKPKVIVPKGAPAPVAPVDPYAPLTAAELDAEATQMANDQLSPQQAAIQQQAAAAKAQAVADEQAITGFRTAEGSILQGIAPQVGAGYEAAAQTQGELGAGAGSMAEGALSGAESAGQAFEASQGQSGGSTDSPAALGATTDTLGGVIPGGELAATGAASQAWAAEQPAIALNAGREELDARMAQAAKDNDTYAQQLISLAATFPSLKQQALTQLNQYEVDKANYKREMYVAQTQRLAEQASARAAGVRNATSQGNLAVRWAGLQFQTQKAAAAAKLAAQKGQTIDVPASKLLGHIVYKNGTENPNIHVKQSGSSTAVAAQRVISTANQRAFKEATSLYGKPAVNKGKGLLSPGTYLAAPGAKGAGVFPGKGSLPATTNSVALAARTNQGAANYADAYQKVLASLAGNGLSDAQNAAIAKRMLKAAGWRVGR